MEFITSRHVFLLVGVVQLDYGTRWEYCGFVEEGTVCDIEYE
jgi:hypothetical protein